MTSTDDDYGQASNNADNNSISIPTGNQHNNYNRRMNSNSSNPYSSNGIEIRILMTSRDAGAVIGMNESIFKSIIN
jgi:hypothetical protein